MMKFVQSKIKIRVVLIAVVLCVSCADNNTYKENFFKNFNTITVNKNLSENIPLNASKHYLEEAQLVEYVVDYKNTYSIRQSKHVKKICDYTKIPFRTSNILHWNSPNFKISQSVRVINIHNPSALNDQAVQKLLDFVANGGTLLFSSVVSDKRFSYFYGFKLDASYQDDNLAYGFKFISPLLPNIKGLSVNPSHKHYGYKLESFKKEVTPLITAINVENYGVVLEHKIGNGRVVFFNTGLMIDKPIRGLVFAMYLPALEGVPYPIANVSTIYLDDFPSPVYKIMKEPIATEMGLTMADFVDKVWWPDMQKLAKEFGVNYTTTITFDYNTKVTPPFIFTEWERNKLNNSTQSLSDYFTKSVLKNKHELGFHGFNHVSLTTSDWKNIDYISTALNTVKKKWRVEAYGELPKSYIPPSNIIDSTGLSKLQKAMPSIKYICSSYFGNVTVGEGREFDVDPYNNKLFDYPRITSEYAFNNQEILVKESTYLFTGIWSHFVHPDDVFQIKDESNKETTGNYGFRNVNGYGWHISKDGSEGLYPRFKKILVQHKNTYPLSKYISAQNGAPRINKWRAADYYHQHSNNHYTVKKKGVSSFKKHYWFVYISTKNIPQLETYLTDNDITYYMTPILNGFLVNIETNNPSLKLPNFKKIINNSMNLYTHIYNDYNTYSNELLASNEDMLTKEIEVDEELVLITSLEQLHEQMFSKKTIDTAAWNNYARMNAWLNKKQDVWKKLDSFYTNHKTLETARYSDELSKISWYPSEQVKEYWLLEQIKFDPNNIELLESYIKYYNTEDNSKRIELYLGKIASLKGGSEAQNNYIKHNLWQKTENTNQLLNAITPSETYNDIADDIAWYYYEKGDLERAYNWANYTNKIDIAIKLDWLYTLEDYDNLYAVYQSHIQLHPKDDKAKAAMAYIYHSLGDIKNAWIVSVGISDSYSAKAPLKKMLNNDIKYLSSNLQKELIDKHPKLFNKAVKDSLIEDIRLKNANSIAFSGDIASDRSKNTSFERMGTFALKDKKKFTHSISFTNSDIYALNTPIIDTNNADKELFGLQYKINNPLSYKKLQYWSEARLEKDRGDNIFYQFGAGVNLSKNKTFASVQYNIHPVKNGVAYNMGIYRNKLGLYYETSLNKTFAIVGYAEGNYYTDNVSSMSLTGKLQYNLLKKPRLKFQPFLESSYSSGSVNQPSGYPYWVIGNRLYGGGGIGGQFGNQDLTKVFFTADAAHFNDDYSDYFTRFNGRLSIRFLKYYVFQTSAEYYIQSEYYSNQFNFGLQYFLK